MLILDKNLLLLILRFSCVRRTIYCLVHVVLHVHLKTKFSTTHVVSISLKSKSSWTLAWLLNFRRTMPPFVTVYQSPHTVNTLNFFLLNYGTFWLVKYKLKANKVQMGKAFLFMFILFSNQHYCPYWANIFYNFCPRLQIFTETVITVKPTLGQNSEVR